MTAGWWLVGNSYGGTQVGQGRTPAEARAYVRRSIAETYADEGLSPSACQRAAYCYHVRVIAGPLSHDQAIAARKAWDLENWQAALLHARPAWRVAYGLPPRPVPIPDSAELEFVRNNKTGTVHIRPHTPAALGRRLHRTRAGTARLLARRHGRGPGTPMPCGHRVKYGYPGAPGDFTDTFPDEELCQPCVRSLGEQPWRAFEHRRPGDDQGD